MVRQSGEAADANYAPLPQTLFATVSALPAPPVQEVSGDELFDVNVNLRETLGDVYALANFGKESGADALAVSQEGVVSAAGLLAGSYQVVVTATASAFLGTAEVVGKGDFAAQFRQVWENLRTAIEGAGGRPQDYATLTMYVTDVDAYHQNRKEIGASYRAIFGKHFPAITLVQVSGLYNPDCMVEVSGLACID